MATKPTRLLWDVLWWVPEVMEGLECFGELLDLGMVEGKELLHDGGLKLAADLCGLLGDLQLNLLLQSVGELKLVSLQVHNAL